MVNEIINILKNKGPLSGKDLIGQSGADPLAIWRFCNTCRQIRIKTIGQRFLRLDKRVEGYARLSPSILREFLTYTVIGLKSDCGEIDLRAEGLLKIAERISYAKFGFAKSVARKVIESQLSSEYIEKKSVFIIAGDVVYGMAHSEIRPEISTGQIIRGSDLDIIIVTKDLPDKCIKSLDDRIYREKYQLIKNPAYREEIDYIIKDLAKVEKQLAFTSFEFMVASKILEEGKFLYGSQNIFKEIKDMLLKKHIPEKLKILKDKAILERETAQKYLLSSHHPLTDDENSRLFFTKEESDEIF